ncbi:hypothetical protein [Acinetobacter brisouii]|uniref:hypothetical protein n=1 Tax=Acinetobacter brisouii TaxID=396323 RepID=UPI001C079858|nr:hypothetical protein [Acinetobacter brisouii]
MNKKNLNRAIAITVIWLGGIGLTWIFGSLKSPESLNELGDFLAGVFAPIAFLWLILGYVQQGKQLDQNTTALEQQERALQLQIHGMKESVQQQKELATIQKQQFDALNKAVKPIFVIRDSGFTYFSHPDGSDFLVEVKFNLTNLGGVANALYIRNNMKKAIFYVDQIAEKETVEVKLNLYELDLDVNDTQQTMLAEIAIDFENLYAVYEKYNYEIYMQTELEVLDREEVCLVYKRD